MCILAYSLFMVLYCTARFFQYKSLPGRNELIEREQTIYILHTDMHIKLNASQATRALTYSI